MSVDDRLPTLRRLTADVSDVMHEREARGRSLGRVTGKLVIAIALLAMVGVPGALGMRGLLAPDPISTGPRLPLRPGYLAQETGSPVYIAHGQFNDVGWGVTARRCEFAGTTTMALALVFTDGAADASPCPPIGPRSAPPHMPILQPWFGSTGGLGTWFYGVVPARVRSIDLEVAHYVGAGRSVSPTSPRVVRVRSTRFLTGAEQEGQLPRGYRVFVYVTPRENLEYTKAVARDAKGNVLLSCTRRACDRAAR